MSPADAPAPDAGRRAHAHPGLTPRPVSGPPRPAVFLDRDGTLIHEVHYLADPERLELVPDAGRALRLLAAEGLSLVVVTNQSGVARGRLDEARLDAIHDRLLEHLAAEDVHLDAILSCPHHPQHGDAAHRVDCDCRKPRPGMLLRASRELNLDLARSFTVGDAERDLLAGEAAGTRSILVETGKGAAELERLTRAGRPPRRLASDLYTAARGIAVEAG